MEGRCTKPEPAIKVPHEEHISNNVSGTPVSESTTCKSVISIAEAIQLVSCSNLKRDNKTSKSKSPDIIGKSLRHHQVEVEIIAAQSQSSQKQTTKEGGNETVNPLTAFLPEYTAPLTLQSKSRIKKIPDVKESVKAHTQCDGRKLNVFAQAIVNGDKQGKLFDVSSSSKTYHNGTKGWFGMQGSTIVGKVTSDQLKADLDVLRMRNYLDPKRFYKSSDKFANTSMLQVGTVIESSAEYYSSRLTKKERKSNFAEEMMSDEKVRAYAKRKSRQLQVKTQRVVQYEKKRRNKR